MFKTAEIKELGLAQLSAQQVAGVLASFNGFVRLFGKPWVSNIFGNVKSPPLVLYVASVWEDWRAVSGLAGAGEIIKRWRNGFLEAGVRSELCVVANLLRNGATVELFPSVGNRHCDLRFCMDSPWVYGEVSQRGLSSIRKQCSKTLSKVAAAAASVSTGKHGMVTLLDDFEYDDIEDLLAWLDKLKDCDQAMFGAKAVFRAKNINSTMSNENDFVAMVSEPKFYSTYFSARDGCIVLKGSACISVPDRAAQELIETEAAQLPRDYPAVVFLDLSSVIGRQVGGRGEWQGLIERRLQPNLNTRISAVVLFQTGLSAEGPETASSLILNRHARNPVPDSVVSILQVR